MNLQKMLNEGVNFLKSGDLNRAKKVFEEVINIVRGLPDGYYYLGLVYLKMGDKKQAKNLIKIALALLHIQVVFDDSVSKIFEEWQRVYKENFNEEYLKKIVNSNKECEEKVRFLLNNKKQKEALDVISNCKVLSNILLNQMFMIYRNLKMLDVLYILGYVVENNKDNKDLLLDVATILFEYGFNFMAGRLLKILTSLYPDWNKPYILIAKMAININGNYLLALDYLKKAKELDEKDIECRLRLLDTYLNLGSLYEIEKEIKDIKKFDNDICEESITFFRFLDVKSSECESLLDDVKHKNIYTLSLALELGLAYGKREYVEKIKGYLDERITSLKDVATKNIEIREKLDKLENVVAFFTVGRGGSFFFHSLIDGHKEVATIPGVYFKGFFDIDTYKKFISSSKKDFIKKFMEVYEIVFDATKKRPVPGDPMSGKGSVTVAEVSGLTTLGENRDIALKVDAEKFAKRLLKYLENFDNMNEKTLFKLIHIVWEEVARGREIKDQKMIFYHIHNPTILEYYRFKRTFNKAKAIFIIRNWLQGLESWMYNSIDFKKEKFDYNDRLILFQQNYKSAVGRLFFRLFAQRPHIYITENTAFVKLEDVKNSPVSTMRAVAKWMGISYDECLLRPEFMGLKFHSNKSKLNPTISEFDKKSIQRKVGVLFSEKDARLLNTVLRPWNEVFEYGEGDFKYLNKDEALRLNEEIMDWERKLIDFFEIKEEDAMKMIKYRKEKLKLALETEKQIFDELRKVELIKID